MLGRGGGGVRVVYLSHHEGVSRLGVVPMLHPQQSSTLKARERVRRVCERESET